MFSKWSWLKLPEVAHSEPVGAGTIPHVGLSPLTRARRTSHPCLPSNLPLRAGERAMELRTLLALVLLPAAVSAQTGLWEALADYPIEASME